MINFNEKIININLKQLYIQKEANINKCPHCFSEDFIKFGRFNEIQRYKCKKCKKTFSLVTNSVYKYLKYPVEKLFKYLKLMLKNETLQQCSDELQISITTAFNWRHKILHSLEKIYKPEVIDGNIVFMRIFYSRMNRKGSRNIECERNNSTCKVAGLLGMDVHTIISYDENENGFIKTVGTRTTSQSNFIKQVEHNISKNTYIKPFLNRFLRSAVINHNDKLPLKTRKKYGYNSKKYNDSIIKDNITENKRIKDSVYELRIWLRKFKGVATKYLDHYCGQFSLNFIKETKNIYSIFLDLILKGNFTSVENIKIYHPAY